MHAFCKKSFGGRRRNGPNRNPKERPNMQSVYFGASTPRKKWLDQISPYGCFPTAVANAFIYLGLEPPDADRLIASSECEQHKGTPDKVKLLRSMRGVHFRRATAEEVLQSAGIITFNCRRYASHSAFFFRSGKRIYCVNASMFNGKLVERISIAGFRLETGDSFLRHDHWILKP